MNTMNRTIEQCKKWAEDRGGECLSTIYVNANTPLLWKCSSGHVWKTSSNKIRMGSWCKECFRPSVNLTKLKNLAETRNGKCLSTTYINNTSKLRWQCSEGHIWSASWQSVNQGNWCPKCGTKRAHDLQRFTIQHCHDIATINNGYCLSTEYVNSDTKYIWKCNENHTWSASYASIAINKTWCLVCANVKNGKDKRNTIENARNLAHSKGGECLSTEYVTAFSKLTWLCNLCNESWNATYNNIQRGKWCPHCKTSKTEKEVRSIIEKITGKSFPKRRFKLKNKRFELDGYCEELKIAFEYDGEQHFMPVSYWGGEKGLKKTQERDRFKDHICEEMRILLIRIPYTEKLNLFNYITDQLITHNVKVQ
jgi:hypothetical protein